MYNHCSLQITCWIVYSRTTVWFSFSTSHVIDSRPRLPSLSTQLGSVSRRPYALSWAWVWPYMHVAHSPHSRWGRIHAVLDALKRSLTSPSFTHANTVGKGLTSPPRWRTSGAAMLSSFLSSPWSDFSCRSKSLLKFTCISVTKSMSWAHSFGRIHP